MALEMTLSIFGLSICYKEWWAKKKKKMLEHTSCLYVNTEIEYTIIVINWWNRVKYSIHCSSEWQTRKFYSFELYEIVSFTGCEIIPVAEKIIFHFQFQSYIIVHTHVHNFCFSPLPSFIWNGYHWSNLQNSSHFHNRCSKMSSYWRTFPVFPIFSLIYLDFGQNIRFYCQPHLDI